MPQSNLVETLQDLVRRHGLSSVLHSLARNPANFRTSR